MQHRHSGFIAKRFDGAHRYNLHSHLELCRLQVSTVQVRSIQVCKLHVCSIQVCNIQVCRLQGRMLKVCSLQVYLSVFQWSWWSTRSSRRRSSLTTFARLWRLRRAGRWNSPLSWVEKRTLPLTFSPTLSMSRRNFLNSRIHSSGSSHVFSRLRKSHTFLNVFLELECRPLLKKKYTLNSHD